MAIPQVTATVLALFEAIGLPGNLLVIVVIVLETRFHVMRNILLASLAASDLLFLLLVDSFRMASIAQERWLYGDTMCYLNAFHSRYFYINTILHLMAVSYDRYDSIVKSPLTYNGTFTKCGVAVIVLIWLIPIGFCIGPFFKWGEYVYKPEVFFCKPGWSSQSQPSGWRTAILLTHYLVPLLVIALLNWTVYKTIKRQANAIAIQMGNLDGCESHQQENLRRRRTERKAALDVSIIIAAFGLCLLPYWMLGICSQIFKRTKVLPEATLVTYCIFTFSSACNPIIYSIRKRDVRRAVKNLFRRWRITIQALKSKRYEAYGQQGYWYDTLRCTINHRSLEAFTSTLAASNSTQHQDGPCFMKAWDQIRVFSLIPN